MAVEEPSVIAAASFAARVVRGAGGFHTWASEPLMTAQVFLEGVTSGRGGKAPRVRRRGARRRLQRTLASLEQRGGGFRGVSVARLPARPGSVRRGRADRRAGRDGRKPPEHRRGAPPPAPGRAERRAHPHGHPQQRGPRPHRRRRCEIPFADAADAPCPREWTARKRRAGVAAASAVAQEDPSRAVTHNKGIMNGISSLALATMNDTRAVEAAAHAWAARSGRYRGLSTWNRRGRPPGGRARAAPAPGHRRRVGRFPPRGPREPPHPRLSRLAAPVPHRRRRGAGPELRRAARARDPRASRRATCATTPRGWPGAPGARGAEVRRARRRAVPGRHARTRRPRAPCSPRLRDDAP